MNLRAKMQALSTEHVGANDDSLLELGVDEILVEHGGDTRAGKTKNGKANFHVPRRSKRIRTRRPGTTCLC
jgi:hypothetical protein